MAGRCASIVARARLQPLVCSKEALVHVLETIGWPALGRLVGLAAVLALPSVVLMMMFGQTRVFFTMARDGLLPDKLASVHPRYKTPHVVTLVTGIGATIAAAVLPVGKLADYSNSGTLFAFLMVAVAVMVLRKTDPGPQAALPHPRRVDHRAAGDHRLPGALFLAAADRHPGAADLGRHGAAGLFPL